MKTNLINRNTHLFPISINNELFLYIKGIKMRNLPTLTYNNYEQKLKTEEPGIKLFKTYQNRTLSRKDLHLMMDIIRDKVNRGFLNKSILTSPNQQAQYISKLTGSMCSGSQLMRFKKDKHPIKSKIKREKLLTKKNGFH